MSIAGMLQKDNLIQSTFCVWGGGEWNMNCLCGGCFIHQISNKLWDLISLWKEVDWQTTLDKGVDENNVHQFLLGDMVIKISS